MAASKAVSQRNLFKAIGYTPHEGQLDIYESAARMQVAACGRRFGKSDVGGHKLVPEAYRAYFRRQELEDLGKRMEFWIVGPEYSDSEKEFRVLYDTLKRLDMPFDRPGTYNDPIGGNLHVSLWGGRYQVHGMSAKYPDSLVGEGLTGVVLSEAAKLKERIWTKYIRPTLADFNGWAFMGSTPEGKNWFYERWRAGQDPLQPDWASWRKPSWTNPFVYKTPTIYTDVLRAQKLIKNPPHGATDLRPMLDQLVVDDEVLSLLNDLTEVSFNQEIAALFTEFTGRVFKEFDEELHVGDYAYDPKLPTFAGVDYGFTNPNVWLLIQITPWDQVRVIDEIYEPGLTANEFADLIISRGMCPLGLQKFYPDPASPGDTKILQQKLRVRAGGGTGGELRHRLDAIRAGLKPNITHVPEGHPDRSPMLVFDRRCTRSIADMLNYRYPEKKNQETNGAELPMKKDDHAPEALGRFFAGHFGTPQRDARRARQRRSELAGAR